MRVRVHPHRGRYLRGLEDCVSVTPHPGSGVYYRTYVILNNVHFIVHRSGFERMQREGKRNVHAWAIGNEIDGPRPEITENLLKVVYDFTTGAFRIGGREVDSHTLYEVAYCIGSKFYVGE